MRLCKESYTEYKKYPEKIIQFGEGNFLRAFVDWMVDKMNREAGFNGSVVVVQPIANGMVEKINEQDGLYTLYLNEAKDGKPVSEHSVINCISRGINPYAEYDAYLSVSENPELRFVLSNTTEAGIAFLESDKLSDAPQTSFPGKLTAFLYHRYKHFNGDMSKGLVMIPCELIDRNGEKLKKFVLEFAKLWKLEDGFITWLNEANTFCCSLVDRVVTGYPKDRIQEIQQEIGYEDSLVVDAEKFHLWVIEGPQSIRKEFPTDKAGLNVLFVEDMTPYRTRKVRILNGAHTSMVPVAYLYGIDTVREAVCDPVIGKFARGAVFDEIIPTLDLSREELESFANDVLNRFENPYIKHYLISIALNSTSKFETRVLPSLLQYQKMNGKLPKKLVFSLAALIAFYKGDRNGERIALNDDQEALDFFATLWKNTGKSVESLHSIVTEVLANESIWKMNLNTVPGLTELVTEYLNDIEAMGIKKAVAGVIA